MYNIVFFGSSDFALFPLKEIAKKHKIVGVVTSPHAINIIKLTHSLNLKLFTPSSPNLSSFLSTLSSLSPDLIFLSAYGHILSPEVLAIPKITNINLHPSLLPHYRGAAPIHWAIINGEEYTGVTTFIMNPKIDEGEILLQKKTKILPYETYGELQVRLSKLGARLSLTTLEKLNSITPQPQKNSPSYAPKIKKEMCKINWKQEGRKIVNLINGLSPSPGAYSFFKEKRVKLLKAKSSHYQGEAGVVVKVKGGLHIGTQTCSVEIVSLKPEGKKQQSGIDFVNGYRVKVGEVWR